MCTHACVSELELGRVGRALWLSARASLVSCSLTTALSPYKARFPKGRSDGARPGLSLARLPGGPRVSEAGYINAGPSTVARCSVSSWSQMAADPGVPTFFELLSSPSPAPSGAFPRQGRGWDPGTLNWTSCLGREVASPGQGLRTR